MCSTTLLATATSDSARQALGMGQIAEQSVLPRRLLAREKAKHGGGK